MAERRAVVRFLDGTQAALKAAGAEEEFLVALRDLSTYLRGLDAAGLELIFQNAREETRTRDRVMAVFSDASVQAMSASDVEQRIADKEVTKPELEAIAAIRFGMPKGSLTKLSRAALSAKMLTLIANERGHAAIRRLLKSPEGGQEG